MNILFDTTFLIQIERKNPKAIALAKKLQLEGFKFLISSVTISEIMMGVYLRKDFEIAKEHVLTILNQFEWVDLNSSIAFKTGEILASLDLTDRPIEYQDVVIAATALETSSTILLTENKKHFMVIPALRDKVFNIEELSKKLV